MTGSASPGFLQERRLEPQITIGLLTDHTGFPLMVEAFEGNKAETLTMIPTIKSFMAAHDLPDVTVVADAGMVSAANQKAIEDAGLHSSSARGSRPSRTSSRHGAKQHPGQDLPDGHVFTSRGRPGRPTGAVTTRSTTSTRPTGPRTLKGIDEQVAKAERAVAGKTPVKRNRFVKLTGGDRSVNRALEAKARSLAGLKGYVTNPTRRSPTATAIGAYHRLFQIEKSFRMSKRPSSPADLPHKRESIDAHLTVVFARPRDQQVHRG